MHVLGLVRKGNIKYWMLCPNTKAFSLYSNRMEPINLTSKASEVKYVQIIDYIYGLCEVVNFSVPS